MTRLVCLVALALLVAASPAAGGPPPDGVVSASGGAGLYAANCSRCHGPHGEGTADSGPSLREAGALAADFYLRTGSMPLASPDAQPSRSRVLFSERQLRALVAYVASLGSGPPVPTPRPAGRLSAGLRLFTEHCAGCHQVIARGGYVTGARVPPLTEATDRQIAEAVRIGPYLMPRFSKRAISDAQLASIIRYVDYAKHPDDPGGWALGHLGPIPEGMVAWLIAGAALVSTCLLIGRRLGR